MLRASPINPPIVSPKLSSNQSPIGSLGPCNGCADLGLVPIPGRLFPDLLPRNAKSVSSSNASGLRFSSPGIVKSPMSSNLSKSTFAKSKFTISNVVKFS